MRRQPLPKAWQKPLHLVLVVAGWALFAWFWWHVLATQRINPHDIAILIAGSLLFLPILTLAWVLHNRNIYRLKGPRTTVRQIAETYAKDWEGKQVHASWADLKTVRIVNIDVDESGKHYRP